MNSCRLTVNKSRSSRFFVLGFSVLCSLFTFLTCEQPINDVQQQPFVAGLGPVNDVRPPTVTLEAPGAGDYISGTARLFLGQAEDDYKIDYVNFRVVNYPAIDYFREYTDANLVKTVQNKGDWEINLDTTRFPDGDLKIRLLAADSVGKTTETADIIFYILNNSPYITLVNPGVKDRRGKAVEDGDIADHPDAHLNYRYVNGDLPDPSSYLRIVSGKTSFLSGQVNYRGVLDSPQIRIWKVISSSETPDNSGSGLFEARLGDLPSETQVPWVDIEDKYLIPSSNGYQFMYPAPPAGSFYGLEIRAQGKNPDDNEIKKFHYPRDFWPNVSGWDDNSPADPFVQENRYVLFCMKDDTVPVNAVLVDREMIEATPTSWDLSGGLYDPYVADADLLTQYNPYVDQVGLVYKNGKINLRIKASHPTEIDSAFIYWELPNGKKGRFIWDNEIYDGGTTTDLTAGGSYEFWGYKVPTNKSVKYFTFTYDPDDNYTGPIGAKMQEYTGSNWNTVKTSAFPPSAGWTDVTNLRSRPELEGEYTIEVYARKTGDTSTAVEPQYKSSLIHMDWTPPKVEFTRIEGIYAANLLKTAAVVDLGLRKVHLGPMSAIANGVINPRVLIYDDGSGMKPAADTYYKGAFEQRYILVPSTQKTLVEDYLKNQWPAIPLSTNNGYDSGPDYTTISPTGIVRHGQISGDAGFRIKTSPLGISGGGVENYTLDDGEYSLFVLARDNVGNIGYEILNLEVRASTDDPELIIEDVKTTVTKPNVSDDPDSFEYNLTAYDTKYYNVLGPGAPINLNLWDDDGIGNVSIQVAGFQKGAGNGGAITIHDTPVSMNPTNIDKVFKRKDQTIWYGELTQELIFNTLKPASPAAAQLPDGIYQITINMSDTINQSEKLRLLMPDESTATVVPKTAGPITFWIAVNEDPPDIDITSVKTTIAGEDKASGSYISTKDGIAVGKDGLVISGNIKDNNGPLTLKTVEIKDGSIGVSWTWNAVEKKYYWSPYNNSVPSQWYTGTLPGTPYPTVSPSDPFWKVELDRSVSDYFSGFPSTATIMIDPQWQGKFEVPIKIDPTVSSNFSITLIFQDRFGRTVYAPTQSFKVDTQPPTVKLNQRMNTFTRRDETRLPGSPLVADGGSGVPYDQYTRLANGVVSFRLSVQDNQKPLEVRWWLVPMTGTVPSSAAPTVAIDDWDKYVNKDATGKFTTWDNTNLSTNKIIAGRLSADPADTSYTTDFSQIIYVDTTSSRTSSSGSSNLSGGNMDDNTLYGLYVMAIDEAGNKSTMVGQTRLAEDGGGVFPAGAVFGPVQIIYVKQAEDKPWFQKNNLHDRVIDLSSSADSGLKFISFTIVDDDGFFNTPDGDEVRNNSITIEMTTDDPLTALSWTSAPSHTLLSTELIKSGNTNVQFAPTFDLTNISAFKNLMHDGTSYRDGVKFYYRITAEDSYQNKYNKDESSGKPSVSTDAISESEIYWFELDTKKPEIKIIGPDPMDSATNNNVFGATNKNYFVIEGYMWDAYLKQKDGEYYVRIGGSNADEYALTEVTTWTPIPTTPSAMEVPSTQWSSLTSLGVTPSVTDKLVHFIIPYDDSTTTAIDFEELPSGEHNYLFFVDDKSNKSGMDTLKFTKDTTPPTWEFTLYDKAQMLLPQAADPDNINNKNWWDAIAIDGSPEPYDSADFSAKRAWEENAPVTSIDNYQLPVIKYTSGGDPPFIKGTFTDDFSAIDETTFEIKIDGGTAQVVPAATSINVNGKNANWTIYLTNTLTNALSATPLCDGVHSIQISVSDKAGNKIAITDFDKMYGFRINSQQVLESQIDESKLPDTEAFGFAPSSSSTDKVFEISGWGSSANLHDVEIRIRSKDTNKSYKRSVLLNTSGVTNPRAPGSPYTYEKAAPGTVPNLLVTETYNFTVPITRDLIGKARFDGVYNDLTQSNLLSGEYEITVIAVDRDNKSSPVKNMDLYPSDYNQWVFVIDGTPPNYDFTNVKFERTDTTSTIKGARTPINKDDITVLPGGAKLNGYVEDKNKLFAVEYELSKWDYDNDVWLTDPWKVLPIPSPPAARVSRIELQTYSPFDGISPLDDGYYCVRLRARDISKISTGLYDYDGDPYNWDTAYDGNPMESAYAFFFVDSAPPKLEIVDPEDSYTSRHDPHQITFEIEVEDANGFDKLEAKVYRGSTQLDSPSYSAAVTHLGPRTRIVMVTLTFNPSLISDGQFKVNFTISDLAKKSTTETHNFSLDNTPPTGVIEEPEHKSVTGHPLASETRIGGQPFGIKGTTDDQGNSPSGVAGVWYRIGYGESALITSAVDLPPLPMPLLAGASEAEKRAYIEELAVRSAKIRNWALITEANDIGNKYFDDPLDGVAKNSTTGGSLWFKYETGADVPQGFILPATTLQLYSWELLVDNSGALPPGFSVAQSYSVGNTSSTTPPAVIRGVTYQNGQNGNSYLARPITGLPAEYAGQVIFSLPLVIRVVDNAGNVSYELREIFLAPYDNPTSKFLVPDSDGTRNNPRGGQFDVEGLAEDDTSIRNVIYRVLFDDDPNSPNTPPSSFNQLTIPGGIDWETHEEYGTGADSKMLHIWKNYGAGITVDAPPTGKWYVANLESPSTKAASMPWYFTLNAGGELSELIDARGFYYDPSPGAPATGPNNMIRVWIEVFVFDGFTQSANSPYNKMSLGSSSDATKPEPYHLEFYFKKSAPSISSTQISNAGITGADLDSIGNYVAYPKPSGIAANYIRGKQFGVRTGISAGTGAYIGEIQIRLPGELGTVGDWTTIYKMEEGVVTVHPTGFAGISGIPDTPNLPAVTNFIYKFDTLSATSGFQYVRDGDWAASGGEFTIDIKVADNSNPPAWDNTTYSIGIDNFSPLADTVKYITPRKVAGSNVTFLGRAFDYEGSPGNPSPEFRGVKEVRAWFTNKVGDYINLVTGIKATTVSTTPFSARPSPNYAISFSGDTVTSITAPATLPDYTIYNVPDGNYVQLLGQGVSTPLAGGIWQLDNNNDRDVRWLFEVDTTNFGDGWITMHYVVIDQGGNASYYTQQMVVMNNYPKITKITLYTDNTGEGAVFTTNDGSVAMNEYDIADAAGTTPVKFYSEKDGSEIGEYRFSEGYMKSGFIAKNKLIAFGVDTIKGNPPLDYEAFYVERYKVPLSKTNLEILAKGIGTLTDVMEETRSSNPDDPAPPTPDASATNININSIVDLLTIAPGSYRDGGLDDNTWRTLGVTAAAAGDGTHFVFQGVFEDNPSGADYNKDNNVYNMAGWNSAYVYVYKQIFTVNPQVRPTADPNRVPIETSPGVLSPLRFSNENFDTGATPTKTKIPEAMKATKLRNAANDPTGDPTGTVFFLIKVTDNVGGGVGGSGATELKAKDMLYDAVVIGMRVYITDTAKPFARLYDLNPYTETAVIGGNSNADFRLRTLNAAASPGDKVGQNILKGGLYNVGAADDVIKSGYIEPNNKVKNNALRPVIAYPDNEDSAYATVEQESYARGYVDYTAAQKISADFSGDTVTDGPANDKVSGQIILRGLAWDNQLIERISIVIKQGAVTENIPILQLSTTSPKKMEPVSGSGAQAWCYEEIDWRTGHTVEWAYLWDTEKVPNVNSRATNRGGPLDSVEVSVVVKDYNGAGTQVNNEIDYEQEIPASTTDYRFHNKITVDIEPYITGIRREYPKYASTRSLQGWYSFFQGEENIRVLGYNMGDSAADNDTAGTRVYLNSTTATGNGTNLYNAATRTYTANTNYPNDGHAFAIPATAASGRLNVTVRGAAAWNHSSRNINKSWNRDYSANTSGSNLWVNRPHAHIWRTNESNVAPRTYFGDNTNSGGSWAMESPSMVLEYGTTSGTTYGAPTVTTGNVTSTGYGSQPGRLHGLWGIRSNFSVYYGANDDQHRVRLQTAQDPMSFTDLAFYPSTNNSNNLTAVYVYQWDALPNLLIRTHMRNLADSSGDPALGFNAGGTIAPYLIRRDNRDNKTDTYRWRNVRTAMAKENINTGNDNEYRPHDGNGPQTANSIAARGNAGRVFTAGYDEVGKHVFFVQRINFSNTPAPSGTTLPLFIDGSTGNNAIIGNTATGVGGITNATRVGNWVAIDYVGGVDTAAIPVIAYYDESNDTLRLAFGTANSNNDAGNNWTRCYVLPSTDPLYRGSGKYVSMKVDSDNRIHLAFYNSNKQTVVYARAETSGISANTVFTAYAVDTVVSGGVWTDISIRDGTGGKKAYIVYGDNGRSGNRDFVRVAYQDDFARALKDPVTGAVITGWEAVTMPADYAVADDRLNIEAWPPTLRAGSSGTRPSTDTWDAAVGYAGTSGTTNTTVPNNKMFRIGYFTKPNSTLISTSGF